MNLEKTESPSHAEVEAGSRSAPDAAGQDVALQLVSDSPIASITASEERRVCRKIDWHIMPLIMITFMFQYIDKVILSGAAQFGIIQDLHLYTVAGINPKTHEPILNLRRYSNATLIFYWGCLAGRKNSTHGGQNPRTEADGISSASGIILGSATANCEVPWMHGHCLGRCGHAQRRLHQLSGIPRAKVKFSSYGASLLTD